MPLDMVFPIAISSLVLVVGFAFMVDYLFEVGITARVRAAFQPLLLRRRQRIARARERRRVAALSPIEAMVEYKKQRREEEALQWMSRLREVMPAPSPYDYEAVRAQNDLFSGDRRRIGKALTPPGGTAQYQHEQGNGYDDLVVRNMAGEEIVRIRAHRP